ncbi:MAG: serine/threonine-protein kinase, partial [Gemmataceae bacterium]|nr:serine/threonine-protein kinase [Gemmataceae bacterium]
GPWPVAGKDPQRRAAQLLATVARAVHYAHQRGILHRDLKPSNILLDANGQPHVADFGLARRVQVDPSLTQSGALVGTPSYMAPEQAAGTKGATTTATDVYGLGAVLYVLLTGRPPFQGDTVLATLEQVQQCEPQAPRAGNPRVDRDLETICLKCLEKDPPQRYDSAEALAEDLERWLAGVPILARPISRMARAWRWCRRNTLVAVLTGTLAALLWVGVVGLVVGMILLWQEKERTKHAFHRAESGRRAADDQRARAERNFRRSIEGVTRLLVRLNDKELLRSPKFRDAQRALLDEAQQFYADCLSDQSTDPEVRLELGVAHVHLGILYDIFQEFDKAQRSHRKAIGLFDQLAVEFPKEADYRVEAAAARMPLGELLWRTRQPEEAAALFQQAERIFQEGLRETPTARVRSHYAWFLAMCPDTRSRDAVRAVALGEQMVTLAPTDPKGWNTLALAHYRAGNWNACVAACVQAGQLHPDNVADHYFLLPMAYWQLGDQEQARRHYQQGLERLAKMSYATRPSPFQLEAGAMLGLEGQPMPKGKEVPPQ